MSDPNPPVDDNRSDVDAETVRDLEPNEESAEEVRGGDIYAKITWPE